MSMSDLNKSLTTKFGPGWLAGAVGQVLRWAVVPVAAVGAIPVLDVATGGSGGAAVLAALADPLSVLAARSPGARPEGALTQSKPRKAGPADERDLDNVLTRPLDRFAAPTAGAAPGAIVPEAVADAAPVAASDTFADQGPVPQFTGGGFLPQSGIVITPDIGGGGGGGGGGSPGTVGTAPPDTVTPVVPVTASVPEPATWLTMLLGFGAVGGMLRSRRRPFAALHGAGDLFGDLARA